MTEDERKELIVRCSNIARDIINECRENGETDLRAVRSLILTAFAKLGELEGEWQPIETAPKDSEILGFQATPGDWENKMSVCWPIHPKEEGPTIWLGSGGLTPTHWMPLPEPPNVHTVSISEASDQASSIG